MSHQLFGAVPDVGMASHITVRDYFSIAGEFWHAMDKLERERTHLVSLSKNPRSPYVLHACDPAVAPHIVVTSPAWYDDFCEPWSIAHNAISISSPQCLQPPIPVYGRRSSREEKCKSDESHDDLHKVAPSENQSHFTAIPRSEVKHWDDPAAPLLAFYRQRQAIILDSDNPQQSPHIAICPPYDPPSLVAFARINNAAPVQSQSTDQELLSINDACLRPAVLNEVGDDIDEISCCSSESIPDDDFTVFEAEPNVLDGGEDSFPHFHTMPFTEDTKKEISLVEVKFHIDEDDEDLGPLPSW